MQEVYYIKFNAFFSPLFTLEMGLIVLILVYPGKDTKLTPISHAAFCLVLSGLFYFLAYLIVGIASDMRYHFWDMLAIYVATVLCLSEKRERLYPLTRFSWSAIGVLAVTFVAITVAQALEGDALFLKN